MNEIIEKDILTSGPVGLSHQEIHHSSANQGAAKIDWREGIQALIIANKGINQRP